MRKEVILAVIIGVLLGGVILYGINLANTSSKLNSEDSQVEEKKGKTTPTPTKKTDGPISITFPLNNAVVTEAQISLKGTAKPNSNIAIITESDDILTTTDSAGSFSSNINLISGENVITITLVNDKLATSSATIYVIRTATLPE